MNVRKGDVLYKHGEPGNAAFVDAVVRKNVALTIDDMLARSEVLRDMHAGGEIAYGIALSVAGMIIFNLGLSYGLSLLGSQSGGLVPAAFTSCPSL